MVLFAAAMLSVAVSAKSWDWQCFSNSQSVWVEGSVLGEVGEGGRYSDLRGEPLESIVAGGGESAWVVW